MTPNQFRAALAALGMTQENAADFLGVSIRAAHGYANGSPIREGDAKLLLAMVALDLKPSDLDGLTKKARLLLK